VKSDFAFKCWAVLLSFGLIALPLYAQVQDLETQEPEEQAVQPAPQPQTYPPAQAVAPAPTYQQPPNTGAGELMPVTFTEAYLQSDQAKNLYRAGADMKSSIAWSLVGAGLSIVAQVIMVSDSTATGPVLALSLGSSICGIVSIVKGWQAGTKLQRASGRLRG
jgi:hypothetical protein